MKDNFIHICFVIDQSGSMHDQINDVIGGFKQTIEEQKKETVGTCAISLYTFDSYVKREYIGTPLNEVKELEYSPHGCTALFDGIGTAVDEIGQWLSDMDEAERPSKNMIVIMTDGEENSSKIYTMSKIKNMIKEQEDKYNWTFIYMGSDLTNTKDVDNLGFKTKAYTTKKNSRSQYKLISQSASLFRNTDMVNANTAFKTYLNATTADMNTTYKEATGLKDLNI